MRWMLGGFGGTSWDLVPIPAAAVLLGGATFTLSGIPGTPSIQNAMPIAFLRNGVWVPLVTTPTCSPLCSTG